MGYKDFFAGKHIILMGLGLLGRGVGDAEFLAGLGAHLTITDLKTEEELAESLAKLQQFKNIRYVLGEHRLENFRKADMIIKAAGVPLDSLYIAEARKAGIPVYMSAALFAKFAMEAGATIVGVTGTRGKSTVSSMIYHTVAQAGKRVFLGGNVRGVSTLATLSEIQKSDVVVLELDSWQLQGFGDLKLSPHIAVFTNLLSDHLNYYQNNPEQYFWDKAQIFLHQKSGDKLIVGPEILSKIQSANPPVAPVVAPPLPHEWGIQLIGQHNRHNAALAASALRVLGVSEQEIKKGLESFQPVEGRLQLTREVAGVKIYNDNNSTTPDATVAALESFEPQKTILIAGGADKGLDTSKLVEAMQHCKKVFLLAGSGSEKIKGNDLTYQVIDKALQDGLATAVPGDTILFSPGFASFGLFKNEYDRNDQFLAAVKAL